MGERWSNAGVVAVAAAGLTALGWRVHSRALAAGAAVSLVVAVAWPAAARALARAWMSLGRALGRVNGSILLAAIYLLIFLPLALVRRTSAHASELEGTRWRAREHAWGPADFDRPW